MFNRDIPILLFLWLLLSVTVGCKSSTRINMVSNIDEYNEAVKNLSLEDEVVWVNGVWKDVEMTLVGEGTEENEAAVVIHDVQMENVKGLTFKNSRKLNQHLNAIEPVINPKNIAFHSIEGLSFNDNANYRERITIKNPAK